MPLSGIKEEYLLLMIVVIVSNTTTATTSSSRPPVGLWSTINIITILIHILLVLFQF